MTASSFVCRACGQAFSVPAATLAKYPGWQPATCLRCKNAGSKGPGKRHSHGRSHESSSGVSSSQTIAQVLRRYDGGPHTGIFTDGACSGNPGPGGWGAVFVHDNEIVEHRYGSEPHTTNNRMELTALIEAFGMLPAGPETVLDLYTDSELCVRTINEWAATWARNGWRRKGGEVKNLDLVRQLYELHRAHPHVRFQWIKAHNGSRWNEYADALSTAFMRDEL